MAPAQNVLIGCSRLVDLAGAEITTLELAEAFRGLGWSVSVASFEVGDYMGAELKSMGARIIDLRSDNAFSDDAQFNLAWIHHCVTADRILATSGLVIDKVIYSSLSHFSPLECPPLTSFQLSRYLVHSEENLDYFAENYPDLSTNVHLMNNSVLARFWRDTPNKPNGELQRLAVVSNHIPHEVESLIEYLIAEGVAIDVFGITARQTRITPDLLRQYDAVMTIGKTVQFGIAAGVPVYCYDHFGGDGWITAGNFQLLRKYNFSGRGGRGRISAEQLKDELSSGFVNALAHTGQLYKLGLKYFVLETNIRFVLDGLSNYRRPPLSVTDSNILIRSSGIFSDLRHQISFRDDLVSDLRAMLRDEKTNASEQICYRDDLARHLRKLLQDEKDNAQAQINYREELIQQLKAQLEAMPIPTSLKTRLSRAWAKLTSR